ncbi:MAG: hypothetical protein JRI68_16915 [Deltaproteobacteria bacterium]|nr:hypothetical protein [Deltaproteobacteria bacterium]
MKHFALTAVALGLMAISLLGCQKMVERKQQHEALLAAQALSVKLEQSSREVAGLSETLHRITEVLADGKTPDEEMAALQKTELTFDASSLKGAPLAALPRDLSESVMAYTAGVHELKDRRDKLVRLYHLAKPQIVAHLAEQQNPTVGYAMVVRDDGEKHVAAIARIKPPFARDGAWPDEFEVLVPKAKGGGPERRSVKRFTGGKLGDGHGLPLDEGAIRQVAAPARVIFEFRGATIRLRSLIEGSPGVSGEGLLKQGKALAKTLQVLEPDES